MKPACEQGSSIKALRDLAGFYGAAELNRCLTAQLETQTNDCGVCADSARTVDLLAWSASVKNRVEEKGVTVNEAYAQEITTQWNAKDSGVGFVTRFRVKKAYMDKYTIQQVGASHHSEWWIPAEDLEDLNANIVGSIEVIGEYRNE